MDNSEIKSNWSDEPFPSVECPQPGSVWKHYKGNLYKIVTVARHTEVGDVLVIYRSLTKSPHRVWARPYKMWCEEVVPGVKRFTLASNQNHNPEPKGLWP